MDKRASVFTFFDPDEPLRVRDIHLLDGSICHAIVFRYQYDGENYLSFLKDEKGFLIQEVRQDYEWRQWAIRLSEGAGGYRNIQTILAIWQIFRIRSNQL